MGAVHKAGAFDDRGARDAGLAQQFETNRGPDDVHNGIDRAHFMEMDRFRGQSVYLALGHGDAVKHGYRPRFDPVG
jgi:hypothetical protein